MRRAALGYTAATGKPSATAARGRRVRRFGGAIIAWRATSTVVIARSCANRAAGDTAGARDGGHFSLQGRLRPERHRAPVHEVGASPGVAGQPRPDGRPGAAGGAHLPSAGLFLCFPREVALAPLTEATFPTPEVLGIGMAPAPDPAGVALIAERLMIVRQSAVVVASSGKDPASVAPLVALCELLALPVVDAAARAYHCFPMDHPLYQAAMSLDQVRLVLVLDADVPWVPGPDAPPSSAFVATVDLDPAKLRIPLYDFEASLRLVSDPRLSGSTSGPTAEQSDERVERQCARTGAPVGRGFRAATRHGTRTCRRGFAAGSHRSTLVGRVHRRGAG